MSCPQEQKDPKQLPCPFVRHPKKENMFVCTVCKKESQIVEKEESNSALGWILFAVVLFFVLGLGGQREQPAQPSFNPSNQNTLPSL